MAVLRDESIVDQLPAEKATKADIISMMVGRKLDQLFPYVAKRPGEVLLKVEGLCGGKAFRDISFSLRAGEIVGLFGLMGAGRSELANSIYGIDRIESGKMYLFDEAVRNPTPEWWIGRGVAYITENRREEGLLMPKTVKENLVLASLRALRKNFRGTRRLSGREGQRGHHRQAEHQDLRQIAPDWRNRCPEATSRRWSSANGCSRTRGYSSRTSLRAASTSAPSSRSTAN